MDERNPVEPTADECNRGARVADFGGRAAHATWYPQMGGYAGKCVVVADPEPGGCFDVWIWHDGQFPLGGEQPAHLHHCSADQFRGFAAFVDRLQDKEGK